MCCDRVMNANFTKIQPDSIRSTHQAKRLASSCVCFCVSVASLESIDPLRIDRLAVFIIPWDH